MNIAYRLSKFPSISETFVLREIAELEERDHTVSVFADENPNDDATHDMVDNIQAEIGYADPVSPDEAIRGFTYPEAFSIARKAGIKKAGYYLGRANKFVQFLTERGIQPDVIHGHFATELQREAQIVADQMNCPHTITAHAYDIFIEENKSVAKNVLNRASHVITVSDYNQDYLKSELDINTDITVVPAGFPFDEFTPHYRSDPTKILSVARCVEKKGLRYAIEAMADLPKDLQVNYTLIGDGELRPKLRNRTEELGISDSVRFLGHVSHPRLVDEMDRAGIFVLPCVIAENGDRDAMPVVLKEAMAMETACISTTVSAIPELIDDRHNGILVDPQYSGAISDAIECLIYDDSLRKKIIRNGREDVKRYDIGHTVSRFIDVMKCIRENQTL